MIQRKNILAENMLRFRSKNIAAEEAAAIRKLIEQVTTLPYKNPTQIEGFFTRTANPFTLAPKDAKTVIFATTLNPVVGAYGAETGLTRVIQLPGFTNLYLAVGTIGTVNDKVTAAVNAIKPGAILFSASPKNPAASATETPSGMVGGESVKFIAYDGNDLAKFANDIVRATGVRTNRVGSFQSMEKQIAAVLKASADLGITGAGKLGEADFYKAWKTATEKLLFAA